MIQAVFSRIATASAAFYLGSISCNASMHNLKRPFQEPPLADVVREVQDSIVTVLVDTTGDNVPDTQGTGWFIEPDLIVTNRHVVDRCRAVCVRTRNGDRISVFQFLAEDAARDLVILSTAESLLLPSDDRLTAIPANETRSTPENKIKPFLGPALHRSDGLPDVGTHIVVLGTPLGFEQSLSTGIVSSVREIRDMGTTIQITAPISPGSSGSPVLDRTGAVIGIATAAVTDGQLLNFAIPVDAVERLLHLSQAEISDLISKAALDERIELPDAQGHLQSPQQVDVNSDVVLDKRNTRSLRAFSLSHFQYLLKYTSAMRAGDLYARDGRTELALNQYRLAEEFKPNDSPAILAIAGCLVSLERQNDAMQLLESSVTTASETATIYQGLIQLLQQLQQTERALDWAQKAVLAYPRNAELHYQRAKALSQHGQNIGMNLYLQHGQDPDFDLKQVLREWYERSIQSFQAALECNPRHIEARLGVAGLYAALDLSALADEQLNLLVQQDPENTLVLRAVAGQLAGRDRAAAEMHLATALKLSRNRSESSDHLANVAALISAHRGWEEYDRGIEVGLSAIAEFPEAAQKSFALHESIAITYAQISNRQAVIRHLEILRRIDGDRAQFVEMFAHELLNLHHRE